MTVVPCGGNDTVPLLGLGPTEWWGDAEADGDVPDVAFADAEADVVGCDALLDAEFVARAVPAAVPVAVPVAVPAAEVEPDDPPQAVSSSTSDPNPAAAAHPVLRITSLHSQG